MNRPFWSAALFVVMLATGSVAAYSDVPPVPHPVDADENQSVLIGWTPGRIDCSDGAPAAVAVARPYPQMGWSAVRLANAAYLFSIDRGGRPTDIRYDGAAYGVYTTDLGPAIAASRFARGAAHHDCRMTFTPHATRMADVSVRDAMVLIMLGGSPGEAVVDKFRPRGTTCFNPRPRPLLRGYPDFARLDPVPGRRSWSLIGFDISATGRPVAPHLIDGSGNAALNDAARDAVARSRFVDGKRSGCLYPYWLAAGTIKAPDIPDENAMRPAGATCPENIPWIRRPNAQYPADYRRRAVEGWGIVAFDTAPWGQTGNLRVLAAEPSAECGRAAINALRSATLPRSDTGYVGCVERVRFVMTSDPAGGQPVH